MNRNRAYYVANRDSILARLRAQRVADPEKYREVARQWRISNPGKVKAIAAKERRVHAAAFRARTKTWFFKNPERAAFYNAKARCTKMSHISYRNYGGRGILFLYSSFEEFLQDVGIRPSPVHSIDRIDNDSHYSRGNCKWSTPSEQAFNRRPKGTL